MVSLSVVVSLFLFGAIVPRVRASGIRLDTNQSVFDYTPTKFRFFGRQQGEFVLDAVFFDAQDFLEFCQDEKNLTDKYGSKIVILPSSYVDLSCGAKFGALSDFGYFVKWCGLVSSIFIRVGTREPGIIGNENDGERFQGLLEANPELNSCIFVDGLEGTDKYDNFLYDSGLQGSIPFRLSLDKNLSVSLFGSIPATVIRLVIFCGFFAVFFRTSQVILFRLRKRKMNALVFLVLICVQYTSVAIGVLELGGSHFTGPVWSSKVALFFFSGLFGTSVAQNFFASALFNQLSKVVILRPALIGKIQVVLIASAFIVFLGDLLLSIFLIAALNHNFLKVIELVGPGILIFLQILISSYQWHQTHLVVIMLRDSLDAIRTGSSLIRAAQAAFLQRIVWGIRLSMVGDVMSIIFMAGSVFALKNRYLLLAVEAGFAISRIISLYGQTTLCDPGMGRELKQTTLSKVNHNHPVAPKKERLK